MSLKTRCIFFFVGVLVIVALAFTVYVASLQLDDGEAEAHRMFGICEWESEGLFVREFCYRDSSQCISDVFAQVMLDTCGHRYEAFSATGLSERVEFAFDFNGKRYGGAILLEESDGRLVLTRTSGRRYLIEQNEEQGRRRLLDDESTIRFGLLPVLRE